VTLNNSTPDSYSNWGVIRHGFPQRSILGPLPFLLYINDLAKSINDNAEMVLFAEDTSIIVTSPNPIKFENNDNKVFQYIYIYIYTVPYKIIVINFLKDSICAIHN
jgi:hypothetical protein